MYRFRPLFGFLAILTALVLFAGDLEARPGKGGSFGSRGSRTFTAPAITNTAPNAASPLQRTMTNRPSATNPASGAAAQGGFFSRSGFAGGLFAGFLGAGLLGMLFGSGLFGGLGGFASILGLILQVALVVVVARLAWAWWQRRNGGLATASGPALRNMTAEPGRNAYAGGGGGSPAPAMASAEIGIEKDDYDRFEQLLSEVSLAYAAEDLGRLRTRVTPEMLSYFSDDLSDNASRGLVNEVSGIKLLQGDLAEAWREGHTEYATVAMRYEIVDATVEREGGRIVEGSREPQEVTELWTFQRGMGGQWILAAIQQA